MPETFEWVASYDPISDTMRVTPVRDRKLLSRIHPENIISQESSLGMSLMSEHGHEVRAWLNTEPPAIAPSYQISK